MNRSTRRTTTKALITFVALAAAACGPAPGAVVVTEQPQAVIVTAASTDPGTAQVAGSWNTRWGVDETCPLTLVQEGSVVSGSYTTTSAPPGTIEGRVSGNVLTGTWSDEGGGGGGMVLTFSSDGRSFTGTWGSGESSSNGGEWAGRH